MKHDHNATKAKTFFYMIPNAQRVALNTMGTVSISFIGVSWILKSSQIF